MTTFDALTVKDRPRQGSTVLPSVFALDPADLRQWSDVSVSPARQPDASLVPVSPCPLPARQVRTSPIFAPHLLRSVH